MINVQQLEQIANINYFYLPLAWLLSAWFGLTGIYIATLVANALVGAGVIWWS